MHLVLLSTLFPSEHSVGLHKITSSGNNPLLFIRHQLNPIYSLKYLSVTLILRGCADKSLARPGRKHTTATKIGIYSTFSPRSSIHFLARCSNFWEPLKKKSESCPSVQISAAAMTSASDEKWRPINCFFLSVEGTGGSPKGSDPENRVGDQALEAQVDQFNYNNNTNNNNTF